MLQLLHSWFLVEQSSLTSLSAAGRIDLPETPFVATFLLTLDSLC